ncbi:antibiotic biosynthesis monooxygenase family protein [Streptomyces minutiscleroticus]|uniref:antibiotic biosynthesis monooxygenase family protein n=1 Tax=Streptomyces minutiscleroticus TaxID=68238 RepID=UPI00331FE5B5
MITVINRLTVHGDVPTFEQVLKGITAHMSGQPGFIGHRLYRSLRNPQVFIETAQWTDAASHRAAMQAEAFQEKVKDLGGLATPEPDLFEILEEDAPAPTERA